MVKQLNINTSHYQGNSQFKYSLKEALKSPQDVTHVAVTNCSVYNNTFNITSSYGNNTITINWSGTNYTMTIPNGYYSVSDINSYLQAYCYSNLLYMNSTSGSTIYFIEFLTNSPRYAIALNLYTIPNTAGATSLSYSLPSGATWTLPTTTTTPTVTFNSAFGSLIGYSAGTYPSTAQSTNSTNIGTITPVISPVNCYVLTCNMLNNNYSHPNNILHSLALTKSYGSLIESIPSQLVWNDIYSGGYNEIMITFYDQNMNILTMNDYELSLTLAFGKLDPKTGMIN
jgi:hypothetical protein